MKSAIYISLLALLGQTLQDEGGLTLDAGEVAMACSVGTPMAPKLMNAFTACSNMTDTEEEEPKKCPAGRKGRQCRKQQKKCPTINQIKTKVSKKMEGEICILSEMGWLDSDGNVNEDIMAADISDLPLEIQNEVSTEIVQTCAMEKLEEMANDPKHARCNAKFNEEEIATLTEFGLKIASYKCFKKNFNDACSKKVKSDIVNYYIMLASSAVPEPMPDYNNVDYPEYQMPVDYTGETMPVDYPEYQMPVDYNGEPMPVDYTGESMPVDYSGEPMPVDYTGEPIPGNYTDDFVVMGKSLDIVV